MGERESQKKERWRENAPARLVDGVECGVNGDCDGSASRWALRVCRAAFRWQCHGEPAASSVTPRVRRLMAASATGTALAVRVQRRDGAAAAGSAELYCRPPPGRAVRVIAEVQINFIKD